MATMNITVQHIDKVSPNIDGHQSITLSCDMRYRDMENIVAQIRERLNESQFKQILLDTE